MEEERFRGEHDLVGEFALEIRGFEVLDEFVGAEGEGRRHFREGVRGRGEIRRDEGGGDGGDAVRH